MRPLIQCVERGLLFPYSVLSHSVFTLCGYKEVCLVPSSGALNRQTDASYEGFDFNMHEEEVPSSFVPSKEATESLEIPETAPSNSGNGEKSLISPNRPHPALEYPLLYFGLLKWPWLFEKVKLVYKSRWSLSYPFQKKVPGSRALRKAGIHLTWGETLLLIPFWVAIICAILYTWVYPSVSVTGHIARTALIACFGFAQRNSIITLLIGMPIDRTLFYHKLSGRVAFAATIGHAWAFYADPHFQSHFQGQSPTLKSKLQSTFDGQVNESVFFMMLFVFGIVLTSLPYFRRKMFEVFYYIHILCVIGVVIGALFHTGILVPCLVAATWGVDLFLRSIVMARFRYPKKATLRILSDTVVELSFPKVKGFDYNPGQYIYISLPELSYLEWHPFSISSAPKMETVTLHIRRAGDWTNALYQLAQKKSHVDIMMEGPYGSIGVNLVGDRYKMVMLVSGGIGSK